ncbi:MAG TPA: DUF3320 domain-containing protein, partial [Kofleriaceae bacterium]|nr:DUF3320 domain-containing protein [Kofleriaceae bacterium]
AAGGRLGELIAPLDADASQLAAVAAAAAGASFVLQGPPGTGKSQTIANLVVHCVAQGKSVLVVADKIAALEVVQQRLASVGLGEFCLELHSHKAVRAQVVAQLGRVLDRAFRPVAGPSAGDARLAELRAALDEHVAAMHQVGPLGRSLHEVLGRLVELRTTARAQLAERDALALDRGSFEQRKLAVEALAAAAAAVEPVASHAWRACTMERWPLDGRDRAQAALDEAQAAAAELELAVQTVAALVPGLIVRTREQLQALGALAALAAKSPRPGAELLTQLRLAGGEDIAERIALVRARGGGAIEAPRDPGSFLVLASRHRLLATEVNDRFTDSVAELDPHALWAQLRRWTHRVAPLRFMALRETRASVRAAAMPGMLETDGAMITALESVIAERAARAALLAAAEPARRWFGDLGGDPLELDLARIDAAVSWAAELRLAFDAVQIARGDSGRAAAWRALVAQVAANPAADTPAGGELGAFSRLSDAALRWRAALTALAEATGIESAVLGVGADHLAALGQQVESLRASLDGMRDWVAFHGAREAARSAGIGPAVAAIERGDLAAGELAAAWERATLLAWADAELAATPALARFHGAAHHAHVAAFADLDRATLALMRSRALVRLAERVPRVAAERGGELGVLLREIRKQRGHRPLRRLFRDIPNVLPRLAPCFLMSPLSVAQYLDPALPRFDVVVFDEASQLQTADAIGALARGNAAVVVGDSRQLPPTRFFAPGAFGAPGDELDELDDAAFADPGDLESVLDDCVAARLPELRLAWHYRSRHEDLIAFANQRYYGDRLQVFPAAASAPDLGISWRRVDGVYDRAGTRQNRAEAEAVVGEVLARLRDPAHSARSIGVVTLSLAQRELIEDLLDEARARQPELDRFFELSIESSAERPEPVIVKNLEAIQGDERDVVLVSIGYGPDASGALSLNLGPLSQRGGERRLNVAITRAREQLILVSSVDPEDLSAANSQGVQDLAAVLAFARAGGGASRAQTAMAAPSPRAATSARATEDVATAPVVTAVDDATTRPVAVSVDWNASSPVAAALDGVSPSAGTVSSGSTSTIALEVVPDAAVPDAAVPDEAPPASPITAAIARALAQRGWTLRHQVGCGAYKVDLAVVDPNAPERYVMAIETDGDAYASATTARDRDRLRAQVLGQLGWRTHRIWSLDWWADAERETQRAHGAIVTAVAATRQRRPIAAVGDARVARATSATSATSARAGAMFSTGRAPRGTASPGDAGSAATRIPREASATGSAGSTRSTSSTSSTRSTSSTGSMRKRMPSATPSNRVSDTSSSGAKASDARAAGSGPVGARAVGAGPAGSGPTDAVAALLADASAPIAAGSAPVRIARNAIAIGPYLAAAIPAGRRAPDDLFAARHAGELGKIVDQVLAAEAPMHMDVLARRVGAYFGIGRPTPRVTEQVRAALAGRGRWGEEDNIVWRVDQDPAGVPAVRVAGQAASARREIDEVPLAEVAAATRIVVERAVGIAAADLVRDAARLLGFARLTDRVVQRVASGVRLAAQRALIRLDDGKATLPDA